MARDVALPSCGLCCMLHAAGGAERRGAEYLHQIERWVPEVADVGTWRCIQILGEEDTGA